MSECTDFFTAYAKLPADLQVEIRDKIIKACGWGSKKTFYNKKRRPETIKVLEAREIIAVFKQHGFNVQIITQA